ncbi:MAG: SBBP repeat-containing protein [Acidobacteriota bacterium]
MHVQWNRLAGTSLGWLLISFFFLSAIAHASAPGASQARIEAAYGKLPIYFEANHGQAESPVEFLARGLGYSLLLSPEEAVLSNAGGDRPATLRMRLAGGQPASSMVGEQRLPSTSHYFIGSDSRRWQSEVPHFGRIRATDVYPGIDLVYYGTQGLLEYDFIVAPQVDPGRITLDMEGVDRLTIEDDGSLTMHTDAGPLRQRPPVLYQVGPGPDAIRQPVAGRYVLRGPHQVGFQIAAYDADRPLVIDPILEYSTYLGDSESAYGITIDATGNAYIVGQTRSANFPDTVGPGFGGGRDVFVAKLNASGTGLIYATYLGGASSEFGRGISLDSAGNAYVVGETSSIDFPTTAGAFQTTKAGVSGSTDAFVTKLGNLGTVVYSTYLGGTKGEFSGGVAVDSTGQAVVTGQTQSTDFPTTALSVQPASGGGHDAFVTKLNAAGSGLVYSSYLGGSHTEKGSAITLDDLGHVYLTGMTQSGDFPVTPGAVQTTKNGHNDAFVAQLDASGSSLVYATLLGGGGLDIAYGIAVDDAWNVYVTGYTNSIDFPVTAGVVQPARGGVYDAFAARLNAAGTALVYATYLGGAKNDYGRAIAIDANGDAYITGNTLSSDFPTTATAPQTTLNNRMDAFITHLSSDGSLLVTSTYLGGSGRHDIGYGIAVDDEGSAYVTGHTKSVDFPTTAGAFQTTRIGGEEAFVTKLVE